MFVRTIRSPLERPRRDKRTRSLYLLTVVLYASKAFYSHLCYIIIESNPRYFHVGILTGIVINYNHITAFSLGQLAVCTPMRICRVCRAYESINRERIDGIYLNRDPRMFFFIIEFLFGSNASNLTKEINTRYHRS